MEAKEIIALGSLAVALVALIANLIRGGKGDSKAAADALAAQSAANAQTKTMLNSIKDGVDDIRVELRTMRSRQDSMNERLASVESSVKSAHHRLDKLEAKI